MARKRRKITPEEQRQRRLSGEEFREAHRLAGWQFDPADLRPRWFGFDGEYDGEAWIDPAKWDACVDDGSRVLRCGHCGESTAFNVRDHLDVLCEGCGTTYMARPVE